MIDKLKIPFKIHKLLISYAPAYLWWTIPQITVSSLLPLAAVYVPKQILESLTDGASFGQTINVILLNCGLLLFLRVLETFFAARSEFAAECFSSNLRLEIGKICMRLELSDIESAEQRKVIQMANNAAKLTGMLNIVRQILSDIITIAGLAWIAVRLNAVFCLRL